MRNRQVLLFTGVAMAALLSVRQSSADEGFWTFDRIPSAAIAQAYGAAPTDAWLNHVQAASVLLTDGCSASLVSANGLVVTADHCASPCIEALSTSASDLVTNGFSAATGQEKRCQNLAAEVLTRISDVTAEVAAAGADRSRRLAELERQCGTPPLRCQVVSFYGGSQLKLYAFRRYDDVRLVFAPEEAIASFGGDPDNFNFPRYGFDVAFLRVYEDGRAARTPEHLGWATRAPKENELAYFSGNPTSTSRDLTLAQLEAQRDVRLPVLISELADLRGRLVQFGEESAEHRRAAGEATDNVENLLKYELGAQATLGRRGIFDAKRTSEADLQARSAATLAALRVTNPWESLAHTQADVRDLYVRYRMLEANFGSGSALLRWARTLVRSAAERERPSGDRLPEFTDARLAGVRSGVLADRRVNADLDRLFLEFWLSKTRERLGTDDPAVRTLLGQESPEAVAARAVTQTRVADLAVRTALWDGGEAAIRASQDPMIQLALKIDLLSRAVRQAWDSRVAKPTDEAEATLATLRFKAYGDRVYPNGTRTPRLSYGRLRGWTSDGRDVPFATDFAGLFARATPSDPFRLPERWAAAKTRLNGATLLDVVTDTDAAPGNSGSPLIDRAGTLIGIEFDGNAYATGGEFGYDPQVFRIISVSTEAVTQALRVVYGETALLRELGVR